MKIEVEKFLAIMEVMNVTSLKKITIITDATGIHFDNEAMTIHVKSSEQPAPVIPEWPWITHNFFPRPDGVNGCNSIEIVDVDGDHKEFYASPANFYDVWWSGVTKCRRTK